MSTFLAWMWFIGLVVVGILLLVEKLQRRKQVNKLCCGSHRNSTTSPLIVAETSLFPAISMPLSQQRRLLSAQTPAQPRPAELA